MMCFKNGIHKFSYHVSKLANFKRQKNKYVSWNQGYQCVVVLCIKWCTYTVHYVPHHRYVSLCTQCHVACVLYAVWLSLNQSNMYYLWHLWFHGACCDYCILLQMQLVDEFLQGPTAPQTFHMAGLLEQVQHIESQSAQARYHPGN